MDKIIYKDDLQEFFQNLPSPIFTTYIITQRGRKVNALFSKNLPKFYIFRLCFCRKIFKQENLQKMIDFRAFIVYDMIAKFGIPMHFGITYI